MYRDIYFLLSDKRPKDCSLVLVHCHCPRRQQVDTLGTSFLEVINAYYFKLYMKYIV